jgi:hypothetical protein
VFYIILAINKCKGISFFQRKSLYFIHRYERILRHIICLSDKEKMYSRQIMRIKSIICYNLEKRVLSLRYPQF